MVPSSLQPQPFAAINGRRRSAIRATRVTGLQPGSTVRELPFVVPLERPSYPGVISAWGGGRQPKRRHIWSWPPIFDTPL